MLKTRISDSWYFQYTSTPWAPKGLTPVTLPHDMVISLPRSPMADGGASNGFWPSAHGKYHRYLPVSDAACTILDVDGAYMLAEVIVNGNTLSLHPHGYTPYLTNLTPALWKDCENKLEIRVSSPQPSTRWYSGGGLYRDVFLWTGGEVRIEPWDLFVTTEGGVAFATVNAKGCITADVNARTKLLFTVKDASGCAVSEKMITLDAAAGEKTDFAAQLSVSAPKLWDLDSPYLYTLETQVYAGGKLTDTTVQTFGIRSMRWSVEEGFLLNGRNVKMRGGCIHHDHGVLGAACYPEAEERKLRKLKAAGFNTLRIAHNPPSLALLEICDRIGLLVMDEAFDAWRMGKCQLDYHQWFEAWWAEDIACMVRRDRNHPCVASYSIGNEIGERGGLSDGALWSTRLADEVRKHDTTRPVTSGICGTWTSFDSTDTDEYRRRYNGGTLETQGDGSLEGTFDTMTEGFMASMDIVGYNYQYLRYLHDHKKYPQRVIWGSETHALTIYDAWEIIDQHNYLLGDFTWTAYDNLGEAGTGRWAWARDGHIPGISLAEYPWRTCYQGDLDLCGYRRPQSYYRETVWGLRNSPKLFTTHPEHYGEGFSGTQWHWYDIHETWTFDESYIGKPVKVDVYTNGDEAEFVLNGKSLGKAPVEKCIATMDIPYEPGTLACIVYKSGVKTGSTSLVTTTAPAAITLQPEVTSITADSRGLGYVDITIVDAEGRPVVESLAELKCTVEGGKLLGIFSADPKNEDVYGSDTCHAFDGRALAIVAADAPGTIRIAVSSPGLTAADCEIAAE